MVVKSVGTESVMVLINHYVSHLKYCSLNIYLFWGGWGMYFTAYGAPGL